MENVGIERTKAENSLIQLLESKMTMNNVYLISNGLHTSLSAVFAANNSSVLVNESTFGNNIGMHGSCFFVEANSSISVKNSSFYGNTGQYSGGVMFGEAQSHISLSHSKFINNTAFCVAKIYDTGLDPGGGVVRSRGGYIDIDGCIFRDNSCQNGKYVSSKLTCRGGVINSESSSHFSVTNSTFEANHAEHIGAVAAVLDPLNMSVKSSVFTRNTARKFAYTMLCFCSNHTCHVNLNNSTMLNNTGGIYVGSANSMKTSLRISSSLFQQNRGNLIIYCENTDLQLQSTDFQSNGDFTNVALLSSGENNELIFTTGNSSVLANDCYFYNTSLFRDFTTYNTNINLVNCTFSLSRGAVYVGLNSTLRVVNSSFSFCDTGCVYCKGCDFIQISSSTFSENDLTRHGSVISIELKDGPVPGIPTILNVNNCVFNNNYPMIFGISGSHIGTCHKCAVTYTSSEADDRKDTIVEIAGTSKFNISESLISISPQTYKKIALIDRAGLKLLNTAIKGYLIFDLQRQNTLEFGNCSVTDLHNGTTFSANDLPMVRMQDSCTVIFRDTTVIWTKQYFLVGLSSTLMMSECDLLFHCNLQVPLFFTFANGSFVAHKTNITALQCPSVVKTPGLGTLRDSMVKLVDTTANSDGVFHLSFWGAEVTIDSCVFTSLILVLTKKVLTMHRSEVFLGSSLFVHPDSSYVLIDNSHVQMDVWPCCTTNCRNPLEKLRVANTTIRLQHAFPDVKNILTWNSTISLGNMTHHTSDEDFLDQALKNGLFNFSQCVFKTPVQLYSELIPEYAETKYAAGE